MLPLNFASDRNYESMISSVLCVFMPFRGIAIALPLILGGLSCEMAYAQSSKSSTADQSRIDLRSARFIDMHHWMREIAESPEADRPADLKAAAASVANIEKALGGTLAWGILEGSLVECADLAAARKVADGLPVEFQSMSGAKLALREQAQALMKAYEPVEKHFVEKVWPQHEKQIAAATERLNKELLPQAGVCLEYIEKCLQMSDTQPVIPIYLVARSPEPGAVTHRRRGGGGVCIVGLDEKPDLLTEIILHECIHALDISTARQPTVLNNLRKHLQESGLPPRSDLMRNVPHTLMFVQAGETVRRKLDPKHRHYGDEAGYYEKVKAATEIVRDSWTSHLEGKQTSEDAIARMVRAISQQVK